MNKLFSFQYWFNFRPESLSEEAQVVFIAFVLILFLFSVLVYFLKSKFEKTIYYKIFRQLFTFGVSNIFVGLLLLFFNYELIPFLAARFWFVVWWLGMAFWLYLIVRQILKIPKIKKERERQKEFKKYLP